MKKILSILLCLVTAHLAKGQSYPCDIGHSGLEVSTATIQVGGTAEFRTTVANYGTSATCEIPAGTATFILSLATNGTYEYNGPISFSTDYFDWTYDASEKVVIGVNNKAIPTGKGEKVVFEVKGLKQGQSTSVWNTQQSGATADNIANNTSTAPLTVAGPLPVSMLAFTAKAAGTDAELNWATASETNNAFFEVQHSTNNRDYETIATVKGKGNSATRQEYRFVHTNPDPVFLHYYRLKQSDTDGTVAYFGPKSVKFDSYVGIELHANATDNRHIRAFIRYGDEHLATASTVSLTDATGRPLQTQRVTLAKGVNTVDFQSSALPAGLYLIRLENSSSPASVKVALP